MDSMPSYVMKPLTQLFRAAPPSPVTLEAQVAALEGGPPDLIIATALGEGDETLRAAAVGKLPDGEVLRRLAGLNAGASAAPPGIARAASSFERAPSALERVAQERVAQLVDAGAIKFAELRSSGNSAAVLSVAGLCGDPAYLTDALASIGDPLQVATLVIEGSSSRIR